MRVVNRTAVTITGAQPFIDWMRDTDADFNRGAITVLRAKTRRFEPRPSIAMLSNAMDVGHPSNFDRMVWLYGGDLDAMRRDVVGCRFTDDEVRATIKRVHEERGYLLDPHSAQRHRVYGAGGPHGSGRSRGSGRAGRAGGSDRSGGDFPGDGASGEVRGDRRADHRPAG